MNAYLGLYVYTFVLCVCVCVRCVCVCGRSDTIVVKEFILVRGRGGGGDELGR